MPENNEGFPWWLFFVAGMILVLVFVGCPGESSNTELARTAREAVELAHDAQMDDRSAVLWSGRFDLLALILGVSTPIVVAYLIWRSTCNGEIDPTAVIECAEQHALPDSTLPPNPSLPARDAPDTPPKWIRLTTRPSNHRLSGAGHLNPCPNRPSAPSRGAKGDSP